MYQSIGPRALLTWLGGLCALVVVGWALAQPPASFSNVNSLRTLTAWGLAWWKLISGSVSAVGIVVYVLGQTRLFEVICRLPLIRKVFPPISGVWSVALQSNWAIIAPRAASGVSLAGASATITPTVGVGQVQRTQISATATIEARLFSVRMSLKSKDRYSASKTVSVRVLRDAADGAVTIHYLFRNTTSNPQPTDSGAHEGAACVDVVDDGKTVRLEGRYWTNRNWEKGLNTAGVVRFERVG